MTEQGKEGTKKEWLMSDADIDDFRVISISRNKEHDNDEEPAPKTTEKGPRVAEDSDPAGKNARIVYKDLEAWVRSAVAAPKSSAGFTEMVRKNKNFRNPAIFEKMISYCNIDEYGTELPAQPPLQEHEYYEEIAKLQEECMKKR